MYLHIMSYVLSQVHLFLQLHIQLPQHTRSIAQATSQCMCVCVLLDFYSGMYSTVVGLTQIVEHSQHSLSPLQPLCWQLSLQQNYVNVHTSMFQKTLYNLCSDIQTSQLHFILIIAVASHIHSYTSVLIQQHSYSWQQSACIYV